MNMADLKILADNVVEQIAERYNNTSYPEDEYYRVLLDYFEGVSEYMAERSDHEVDV